MAKTNDTIDGLLAEFRGYSAGMPASYHVTMSWADFCKMLDRFEAAHKRERGDCAKLREACANIAEYARSAQCHTEDAHVLGYLNQIEGWAKAALAAPARNCDRFASAEEAWDAYDEWVDSYRAQGKTEPFNEFGWLFAPATEKEGGAK